MSARKSYESVFRPGLFAGKVALVTGGGSGIGRCIARELLTLGARVMIAGRTQDKLDEALGELRAIGGGAESTEAFACDIREEEAVRALVAETLERFGGRLDLVVNNAGGQFPAPLEKISKNGWEAVVRNNLTGTFLVSREALTQAFQKQRSGVIVNVLADFRNGMPFMGHSGAARAGVDNFTKTAAIEWAKYGVRINSVAPGIVESSGLANYAPEFIEAVRGNAHKIPFKRFATESEISAAVVFLLSPGASYVTGALLNVDGGSALRGHTVDLEEYGPLPEFKA